MSLEESFAGSQPMGLSVGGVFSRAAVWGALHKDASYRNVREREAWPTSECRQANGVARQMNGVPGRWRRNRERKSMGTPREEPTDY